MIDTHVHLEFPDYGEDREDVIDRARAAGVRAMICVGGEPVRNRIIPEIVSAHEDIYFATGLHPHWATSNSAEESARIAEELDHDKAVAVGEIGLDYHYDYSPRDMQKQVFRGFLTTARERGVPVIVHSREASQDTLDILGEYAPLDGVVHCFSYGIAEAEAFLSLGLHISFCGQLTFKKCDDLRATAAAVPLERLLLETDCPFLSPEPYRGKRNEPARVTEIAQAHAAIRETSVDEIVAATTRNACALFGLSLPESTNE